MTRDEHLKWAKERALEYVDNNDLPNALASLTSDLNKHDDLRGHPAVELGMMLLLTGNLSTPDKMRKHIKGFN